MIKNISKTSIFMLSMSAAGLINVIANFIAMIMVTKVGANELAAAALAVPTLVTFMTVFTASLNAVGILISHNKEQNTKDYITNLVKNGFWLAFLLAIPASLILWNLDKFLLLCGQNYQLVKLTQSYFHFAALNIFPVMMIVMISQFITAIGHPRFTLITSFISLPLIILLSYALILGKFGCPKMALAGVTCSLLIVQSCMLVGIIFYLIFNKEIKKYKIFNSPFLPNWSACKTILTLGLPIGIQLGLELAGMTVISYFMGFFGVIALASSHIVTQYSLIVVMLSLGLSQALSVLISEANSQQNGKLLKQYIFSAFIIYLVIFSIVVTLFITQPKFLVALYINENTAHSIEIINLAIGLFFITAISQFLDGTRNFISGILRGFHDTKMPMKIGIFGFWGISIPASYITAFVFHGGPIGLRGAFISGFVVAIILLALRVRKLQKIFP